MQIPFILMLWCAPVQAHPSELHLRAPESLESLSSLSETSERAAYAAGLESAHETAAVSPDGTTVVVARAEAVDAGAMGPTTGGASAAPAPTSARVPAITDSGPAPVQAAEDEPSSDEQPPSDEPPPAPPPDDGGGGAGDAGAVAGAALLGGLLCLIGFLAGGPIGAAVGFLVGAFLGALFGGLL